MRPQVSGDARPSLRDDRSPSPCAPNSSPPRSPRLVLPYPVLTDPSSTSHDRVPAGIVSQHSRVLSSCVPAQRSNLATPFLFSDAHPLFDGLFIASSIKRVRTLLASKYSSAMARAAFACC